MSGSRAASCRATRGGGCRRIRGRLRVAGAPFDSLATSARARVILARGERDPMVSTAELRAHASEAVEIAGCGHNVHVEKPEAIVDLLQSLIASSGDR